MVSTVDKILEKMKKGQTVTFNELYTTCQFFFGEPRRKNGSHVVFKMPWAGDPRVNIQNDKGNAKPYQIKQVLKAIERLEATK